MTDDPVAQCAHLRVREVRQQESGIVFSTRWECFDCRQEFVPKPSDHPMTDDPVGEARRLRDEMLSRGMLRTSPSGLAHLDGLVAIVERVAGERDEARIHARDHHIEKGCLTCIVCETERDAAIRERDEHVCLDPAHPDCIVLLKSAADFLVGTMRNAEGLLAECQAAREKGEFIGMGCGKCAPVGEPSVFNIHAPSGCKAEPRP